MIQKSLFIALCTLSFSLSCGELRRRAVPAARMATIVEEPTVQPMPRPLTEDQITRRSTLITCCCALQTVSIALWATHSATTASQGVRRHF